MIEGARESIELEYFIYDRSSSSRLVNQALVKKAQERGYQVNRLEKVPQKQI